MAYWLDFKNGAKTRRRWTDEEIGLLLAGQRVPYRTAYACTHKRRKLGFRKGPGPYLAKAPYEPPKPVPGKIPWPRWWRRVHLMRVEGYRVAEIARLLGRHPAEIRGALYPHSYEQRAASCRRYHARKMLDPVYYAEQRAREREALSDRVRKKARFLARSEWRAAGGAPSALEGFYRAFECL